MNVKGQVVYILGDSLSVERDSSGNLTGSPGRFLAEHLRAAGKKVKVNARVGRSAKSFMAGLKETGPGEEILQDDLFALTKAKKPEERITVLLCLGTNDAAAGLSKAAFEAIKKKIADFLSVSQLIVIGPPSFAKTASPVKGLDAVYRTLFQVFGDQAVLDARPLSRDLTEPGKTRTSKDGGVHFTTAAAKAYAARLAGALGLPGGEAAPPPPAPAPLKPAAPAPAPAPTPAPAAEGGSTGMMMLGLLLMGGALVLLAKRR